MEAIQNKTTNKIVGIKNAGWVIKFVSITSYWGIHPTL